MTNEEELKQIISKIPEYAEFEALAVVTKEGARQAFWSKSEVDPDLLSAMAATILQTSNKAAKKMGFGSLFEVIVRGENGYMVLSDAGPFVLIGAGREVTSLGLSIRVLREFAKKISEKFSE